MGTGDRLLDILCHVCGDRSSGKHYGIYSCDGCSGFFKRSIHSKRQYTCKAQGRCTIDKTHRNQCRACRLNKCFQVKMNRDAVQHERGPRKPKNQCIVSDKQQRPALPETQVEEEGNSHPVNFAQDHILRKRQKFNKIHRLMPYPQTSPLCQKMSESSSSSGALVLSPTSSSASSIYQTARTSLGSPSHSMLQMLMTAEKCQKQIWTSRLQSENDYSHWNSETETSHSPTTGAFQGLDNSTWDTLQETSARLLFMAVRWVRGLMPFQTLPREDQLLLLERGWAQLFLLHFGQWSISWNIKHLFDNEEVRTRLPGKESQQELVTLQHILETFRDLEPDIGECGCLKAIILFIQETCNLMATKSTKNLQTQAQYILGYHIQTSYPNQGERFGRLLLMIASLRSISSKTVESLFFRDIIGEIPIARLLVNMYESEGN